MAAKFVDEWDEGEGHAILVRNLRRRDFERCGIIPYFFDDDGDLFIYLGVDKKYNELTDFGGRVSSREDFIRTAKRELEEEARRVFENMAYVDLRNCLCIHSKTDVIIFMPTQRRDPDAVRKSFHTKRYLTPYEMNRRIYNEMSDILLLNESLIQQELLENKSKFIYKRVHALISNTVNNVAQLKRLLP